MAFSFYRIKILVKDLPKGFYTNNYENYPFHNNTSATDRMKGLQN